MKVKFDLCKGGVAKLEHLQKCMQEDGCPFLSDSIVNSDLDLFAQCIAIYAYSEFVDHLLTCHY